MSSGELCPVTPENRKQGKTWARIIRTEHTGRHGASLDLKKRQEGRTRDKEQEKGGREVEGGHVEHEDCRGHCSKAVIAPKAPWARELEEHMVSHWPCRNWFEHCAGGKAKSVLHRNCTWEPDIPIVGIGIMWMVSMVKSGEDNAVRVFCFCRAGIRVGWRLGSPRRYCEHWGGIEAVAWRLGDLGYNLVVLSSGQELAMLKLKDAAKRQPDDAVTSEESLVAISKSVGNIKVRHRCLHTTTDIEGCTGNTILVKVWKCHQVDSMDGVACGANSQSYPSRERRKDIISDDNLNDVL